MTSKAYVPSNLGVITSSGVCRARRRRRPPVRLSSTPACSSSPSTKALVLVVHSRVDSVLQSGLNVKRVTYFNAATSVRAGNIGNVQILCTADAYDTSNNPEGRNQHKDCREYRHISLLSYANLITTTVSRTGKDQPSSQGGTWCYYERSDCCSTSATLLLDPSPGTSFPHKDAGMNLIHGATASLLAIAQLRLSYACLYLDNLPDDVNDPITTSR
ncbi:hypothetical protein P692DRAFT_20880979 [Suillus brevipes Sb2]|nr:hypothetical protein P692DRAFT_20880979 [Suillus brevipes Sb2]